MLYELRDNWAERSYMVRGADLRSKLYEILPQCDCDTEDAINFIADFYEGKHNYRSLTIKHENDLLVAIYATGASC